MTLPSWLTTKFYTFDKPYHAIGSAGAYAYLWFPVCLVFGQPEWLCALLIWLGGIVKEFRDSRWYAQRTFFDYVDILANTVGILLGWFWIRLMVAIAESLGLIVL